MNLTGVGLSCTLNVRESYITIRMQPDYSEC